MRTETRRKGDFRHFAAVTVEDAAGTVVGRRDQCVVASCRDIISGFGATRRGGPQVLQCIRRP